MGERRGHPVVAAFIVVVTLFGVLVGAVLAAFGLASSGGSDPKLGPGYEFLAVMGVAAGLVGGLWWAKRVGTGYWGLGSRPRVGKGRRQQVASPSPTARAARHTRRCPGCGEFVDHELETCPHCRFDLREPQV